MNANIPLVISDPFFGGPIQGDGFAVPPENYGNYTDFIHRDWVPVIGNVTNPLRVPSWLYLGFPNWVTTTPTEENWMEHTYGPYYNPFVQNLAPNAPCVPID